MLFFTIYDIRTAEPSRCGHRNLDGTCKLKPFLGKRKRRLDCLLHEPRGLHHPRGSAMCGNQASELDHVLRQCYTLASVGDANLKLPGKPKLSFLSALQRDIHSAGWTTIVSAIADVTLVALGVYWVIMLSRRRPAWQILWGILAFFLLVYFTDRLQLNTLNYLLRAFLNVLPIAVVILFLPELRQMLENLGNVAGWGRGLAMMPKEDITSLIHVVSHSAARMSERKIGALIVVERESSLDDLASTGTRLNAAISEELIGSIFYPGGPLHDGAIIVRGTRIVAAGCTLPLSESAHVGTMIHTRHKAALGVAEESDAAVVVVSEETGTISLALEGKLHRGLDEESLAHWLRKISGALDDHNSKARFARTVDGTLRKARLRRR